MKQAKLYTTEGNPKMVQWYTANGFHAVPLSAGEIPKQLKLPTGAINAAPMPPVYAVALQIFKDAPYMLDIRLAPLVGATVMTDARLEQDLAGGSREDARGRLGDGTADQRAGAGARCQVDLGDEGGGASGGDARRERGRRVSRAPPSVWARPSAAR